LRQQGLVKEGKVKFTDHMPNIAEPRIYQE
jgi:hypothetical protein